MLATKTITKKDDDYDDDDNLSLSEWRHNTGRPVLIDNCPVGVSSVEPAHVSSSHSRQSELWTFSGLLSIYGANN